MNYFVSCIYGQYDKFMEILDDLNLKNDDMLWILGDVLDGNDSDPSQNIKLLDEIMNNPNIKLVLGDHEFVQNMRYVSLNDEESYNAWCEYGKELDVSGASFNEYIETEMSREDQDSYFGSFLLSLELSEVVKIGDRYFYLVHGSPFIYREEYLSEWQRQVCTMLPNLTLDYWLSIRSDPMSFPYMNVKKPMTKNNTIVISGQLSPQEAADSTNRKYDDTGVFYYNNILAIGRNDTSESITVLGIDAAGFFVKGIY